MLLNCSCYTMIVNGMKFWLCVESQQFLCVDMWHVNIYICTFFHLFQWIYILDKWCNACVMGDTRRFSCMIYIFKYEGTPTWNASPHLFSLLSLIYRNFAKSYVGPKILLFFLYLIQMKRLVMITNSTRKKGRRGFFDSKDFSIESMVWIGFNF